MNKEAILNIAEYVGANERLKLDLIADVIKPYLQHYDALYRLWVNVSYDNFHPRSAPYLAVTKSEDAIAELIEESDPLEGSAITFHSGFGFEPCRVLRDYKHVDSNYISQVLGTNAYQQEVILLKPDEPITIESIVGFVDSGEAYFF